MSHGWLPLTSAKPQSNWDTRHNELSLISECTHGWCPLMKISQDAHTVQGHTTQYTVQSPTWTCGHLQPFNMAPNEPVTTMWPYPFKPHNLLPMTCTMAQMQDLLETTKRHGTCAQMMTGPQRRVMEGGHANEDCCRG